MQNNDQQFDFLYLRIQQILDQSGFAHVSEETRDMYLPQFVAEAERRIGLAVMPLLNEDSAKELAELIKNADTTTPEQMQQFWQTYVPNFPELVDSTLTAYAEEIKQILSTL